MFLRHKIRNKDGKRHRYWSVVENKRVAGGRRAEAPASSGRESTICRSRRGADRSRCWTRRRIDRRRCRCFPRIAARGFCRTPRSFWLKLSELRLCRPRQCGACWLVLSLWEELRLDRFWAERLPASRKGTRWDQELFARVAYRLLAPGSEWRLHREWFERTALADLLGGDFGLAEIHKLYRRHDRLLEHKEVLFDHLTGRWRDLFNARFDLLLYDLTSTYFEAAPPFADDDKRRFGYSRDHRPDCVQVVIALVITPEGLPLAYEVLSGATSDKTTLRDFLSRIERQYGKARRIWLMDRGIPTEEVLAEMRRAEPARAISGRHAEGTPEPPGTRAFEQALARGPARRAGQAVAPERRALCLRPEPRQGHQGARNAQATIERAMGAVERPAPDVRQSDARLTADQIRTRMDRVSGYGNSNCSRSQMRQGSSSTSITIRRARRNRTRSSIDCSATSRRLGAADRSLTDWPSSN
jgi:hypothetical protein